MGVWAKALEALTLEPIFGVKPWAATSDCSDVHPNGPMPKHTKCCCMACHQTGKEGHPALRESALGRLRLKDWKPSTQDGRDEWSHADGAEPTKYVGPSKTVASKVRAERRAEEFPGCKVADRLLKRSGFAAEADRARGYIPTLAPEQIARMIEPGD